MNKKLICSIPSSLTSYEIEVRSGILKHKNLLSYLSTLGSRFALISDDHVASLYGQSLRSFFSTAGLETYLFTFPSGESYKTRTTKERLEDQLFSKGLGRDTCVVAIGGGVATDLGGYLAATYCRGVPLVMIPTSLLGMVDASIGGKTAVNVPWGKNMLGCIYQPKKVIIDPETLKTLSTRELRNGVVEMLKHAIIADADYFHFLEEQVQQLFALDSDVLEKGILESCRIKKEIVEQDEKELGKRHLLNFGHTVGHALETLSAYSLSHGEAVAIGILFESHLAVQLNRLSQQSFDRIHKILVRYGLPLQLPHKIGLQEFLNAMILDKKSLKGLPRFIIINEIGSQTYECTNVEQNLIKNALQWMNHALCCH